MPKYRVREKSLIGNEIFEAGATVDYDGLPAENLEPLDEAGHAKYAEYVASNEARVAKMKADNPASGVGDATAFQGALLKLLAEQREHDRAEIGAVVGKAVADALAAAFPNGLHKPAVPPDPEKLA